MDVLGIDIGGSGIKGAVVDTDRGAMKSERHRIPTPQPATPHAVSETVAEITKYFKWQGPVGITFPAVVQNGIIHTAANVDDTWIDTDAHRTVPAGDRMPGQGVERC